MDDRQEKTYAVVFDPGDEVMAGLKTFADFSIPTIRAWAWR